MDITVNRDTGKALDMRRFLRRLVAGDRRAKQLFKLYFDRGEISEQQFFEAISK
ncbi:MAG: hypothetical protein AAGB35_02260 [Pseudomonadota bacterium]